MVQRIIKIAEITPGSTRELLLCRAGVHAHSPTYFASPFSFQPPSPVSVIPGCSARRHTVEKLTPTRLRASQRVRVLSKGIELSTVGELPELRNIRSGSA
jgi:hypothetical protein